MKVSTVEVKKAYCSLILINFRFQKEGLNCSVSTDDPGIMITTLLTDYHIVTDEMGLSIADLKDMVSFTKEHCLFN